jgi:pimeloyl-ACP methyl ester carboxylesterase
VHPTCLLAPACLPRHTRLRSALRVALAAVGCAPAGPRHPQGNVEALRHTLAAGAPQATDISYLRSPAAPGQAPGARLLLVHGTPGSAASWADYLLQPPPALEVLAIDRPGFGRSGPAFAVPQLAAQAAAVRALLPAPGRAVVLLGHSLGGPVVAQLAATLAVEDPQRPVTLVLLAASLDPAQESIHPLQWLGAWAPVRALLPRVLRNANAELMALQSELQVLTTLLPRITARVLIVHGTQDDLVPVANVPYIQARLSSARCVKTLLLPGRNHFLPWNAEAEVRDVLRMALEGAC